MMRVHRGVSAYRRTGGRDLSEERTRRVAGRRACKAGGRDQGLVYQPRDSRRLSRVPRDEFIGFIIKRGSGNTPSRGCNSRTGNLYISPRRERTLEIRGACVCASLT